VLHINVVFANVDDNLVRMFICLNASVQVDIVTDCYSCWPVKSDNFQRSVYDCL